MCGGKLTRMCIHYREESSPARLADLLRRQRVLAEVLVDKQESIPALCQAIVQGRCRKMKKLHLAVQKDAMTWERQNLLAAALEVGGALLVLRTLHIDCPLNPGGLSMLARALMGGTSPQLQKLRFDSSKADDNDMNDIAIMIEARAGIPGCQRLESVEGENEAWFDRRSREVRIRLLRALLPSVNELPPLTWHASFEACFCESQWPFVTRLEVFLDEESFEADMTVFSSDVLASMPSIVTIKLCADTCSVLGARALESITAALQCGALQALQRLELYIFILSDDDLRDFADVLGQSSCAQRLVSLQFRNCQLTAEGLSALVEPLGRGVLPALKDLCLCGNSRITDLGVGALAEALQGATQTYLWSLDLRNVEMGHAGMEDLAFLVRQGRLEQLRELFIAENSGVSDEGIAINEHGLPALTALHIGELKGATAKSIRAIVKLVLDESKELTVISLKYGGPDCADHSDMFRGMLQARGRATKVTVVPPVAPFSFPFPFPAWVLGALGED